MLAQHLGARVYKHADGHARSAITRFPPSSEGRTVCKDWPDTSTMATPRRLRPAGSAVMLAEGDSFPFLPLVYGGKNNKPA